MSFRGELYSSFLLTEPKIFLSEDSDVISSFSCGDLKMLGLGFRSYDLNWGVSFNGACMAIVYIFSL